MASQPLRPSRSLRRPNSNDRQEKSSLEIVRSGSVKSRPVKKRDSIDLAKQSHALRNAPLPPLPPMQRSATSPWAMRDTDVPQVPSKIPGDGRPMFLPPSPLPPRKLSLRRKQKTTPDIMVPEKYPQRTSSLSPMGRVIDGRQSLGSNGSTPPGSRLLTPRTSSLSDGLGPADCPQGGNAKNARWNLLGGLFGRKASTSAPTSPPPRMLRDSSSSGEKSLQGEIRPAEVKGGLFRSRSKLKAARNRDELGKPAFNRARTAPIRPDDISKPLPALGMDANFRKGSVPLSRAMLDVEIPNVQLERYSVMFENLLDPNNSSSLSGEDQAAPGSSMEGSRGRQQSTPTSHPWNTGPAPFRSRVQRGKSRNLSIDLGLSSFPAPSGTTRPGHPAASRLKTDTHRRSRTLADFKLAESPSITEQMEFILQSPAKSTVSRSRLDNKVFPLPPPPPPPLPKSASDFRSNRVASPRRDGGAVHRSSSPRKVVKQQSSHQVLLPPWETHHRHQVPSKPSKQVPEVLISRQISFSRRNLRPEPPSRSTTAPIPVSSAPLKPKASSQPPLPTPPTALLPSSAPPWNTTTNIQLTASATPSSAPPWNPTNNQSTSSPPPSSAAPPWSTNTTSNTPAALSATLTSLSDLIQATSSSPSLTILHKLHDNPTEEEEEGGRSINDTDTDTPSERYVDRKALGHFPTLVTHSPSSPEARKSQQVLLECA